MRLKKEKPKESEREHALMHVRKAKAELDCVPIGGLTGAERHILNAVLVRIEDMLDNWDAREEVYQWMVEDGKEGKDEGGR